MAGRKLHLAWFRSSVKANRRRESSNPLEMRIQGTAISQNRLEPSTSIMFGASLRIADRFLKLSASVVVARKPSLQTITPLPVAW